MNRLPVWSERERPTTVLIDHPEDGRDIYTLPPGDEEKHPDYLAWVNGHRQHLQGLFAAIHPQTAERLAARGIELSDVNDTVADITGRLPYPERRIITASDARGNGYYREAAAQGFYDLNMKEGDWEAYAQFQHVLQFIRLRGGYINRAPVPDVVDTVANMLGRAALCTHVYTHIDYTGERPAVYNWNGYAWRYDDEYVGQWIENASAAKVAAVTRARLGVGGGRVDLGESLAAPYQERRGFGAGAVGAMTLDVLNTAGGHGSSAGLYEPIWRFMASGQDEGHRDELAVMVAQATDLAMSLEELESQIETVDGLPLEFLERVEEVCGVEASRRPSGAVRQLGVY
ncbi:hypothetical protein JNJ66_01400 [Candidatus Saccharibacteria bacterium]|nr:hypothetical protein [Candidatus Saccharibacteria bacterium]